MSELVGEQPTKVVKMNKTEEKEVKEVDVKQAENKTAVPQQKMFLISETAVNQLLNSIAEMPGLTWKQTNPLIVFIQQNVVPFQG